MLGNYERKKTSGTLNVLMASSDYHCPFAGVSLQSSFENNTDIEELNVYIISDNILKTNLDKLHSLFENFKREIFIIDGNKLSSKLKKLGCPKNRNAYVTYYKLFFLDFIPENVERLLYLDSDILVEGSLRPLIDIDLKDNIIGMCIDIASKIYKEKWVCPIQIL